MLRISRNNTVSMYRRSLRLLATKSSFTPLSNASIKVKKSFPQFAVGLDNGFLPRTDPLQVLPKEFSVLDSLLKRMPLKLQDGKPGLLAQGKFGEAVDKELKVIDVSKIEDSALLTALFRDYTFAASAYLLEPCDLNMIKTGSYGLGRSILPKQLAIPLAEVSKKIGAKPFMEYAMSYALFNYKRKAPGLPLIFKNLELIRSFQNNKNETGFILVHVAMVAYSGHLVSAVIKTLDAVEQGNRAEFDKGLGQLLGAMRKINQVMETMWKRSEPGAYKNFRTFIMGTKNQPMFPKGVLYEGVSDIPQFFRGESGANDSIIPTCDNLLQITETMPTNELTEILKDFRSYRPVTHNEWLSFVERKAIELDVRSFAKESIASSTLYLAALDQVREFRDRHWKFTKEYILKHQNHPVATGGSPIATWLPNQLAAVLDSMNKVYNDLVKKGVNNLKDNQENSVKVYDAKLEGEEFQSDTLAEEIPIKQFVQECGDRAVVQRRVLNREVAEYGSKLGKSAVDAKIDTSV